MKTLARTLLAAAALLLAVSCGNEKPLTEHVILISLDGMSSADFLREEMPTVSKMMDEGCWTLAKRSVFRTSSAINWASMFMGAGTELTGYTEWYSKTPELPSRVVNEHGIFPTIHYLVKSQMAGSKVGAIYEWGTIAYLVDTLACDYFEKADSEIPTVITDKSISCIKNEKPTFLTISYDHPDHKGHGGIRPAEYETPFIIAGKGIRKGGEFTESMMQYDVAATVAGLFRLEQPQAWVGRPMSQCFE